VLFIVKIDVAVIVGIIAGRFLGESLVTAGIFAGISTLALVASLDDTNGGRYMALIGKYGRLRDVRVYTIHVSLESGPFLPW